MLDEFGLKPGDVFTWDRCPFRKNENDPLKKRWFILLGYVTFEDKVFIVTTTTRTEHYGSGKDRDNHTWFDFVAGTGGLEQYSIIDLTQDFQELNKQAFVQCKANIQKAGSLLQDNINRLVNHIEKARNIPKIIKKIIYECLRNSGYKVNIKGR